MLVGSQIRAARALIKLSSRQLAEEAGLSYAAVQRAESVDDLPSMHTRNLAAIKAALEAHGVVFIDGQIAGVAGTGPCVRLRR